MDCNWDCNIYLEATIDWCLVHFDNKAIEDSGVDWILIASVSLLSKLIIMTLQKLFPQTCLGPQMQIYRSCTCMLIQFWVLPQKTPLSSYPVCTEIRTINWCPRSAGCKIVTIGVWTSKISILGKIVCCCLLVTSCLSHIILEMVRTLLVTFVNILICASKI